MRSQDAEAAGQAQRQSRPDEDWHRPAIGFALVAMTVAVFVVGVVDLPRATAALPDIARQAMEIALPVWGQNEVVSEVVYGSRGWDTFGETFLLLAAVVSVIVLTRAPEMRSEYVGEAGAGRKEQADVDPKEGGGDSEQREARGAEQDESDDEQEIAPNTDDSPLGTRAPERAEGMTIVVRLGARIAAVVLAVAGLDLFLEGYTPGGGFPAGAVLMDVVLVLYVALGRRAVTRAVRPSVLEPIEIVGAVAVVVIGLLGLLFKGSAFANYLPLAEPGTIIAGGTNQLFSGAEMIEVATGLSIATFSLLGMRHDWAPDQDDRDEEDESGDDS